MPVVDPSGAQLSGPVVPIDEVYIGRKFPRGEEVDYQGLNAYRSTSEEKRKEELLREDV